MKALKKIVLFILISAVFITCKKEVLTPSSTTNQPVFAFSGNINGNSINWQAGVNNYYMYSSDSQSVAGIYKFIGTLQNTTSSKNSIQIIINDDTTVGPGKPSNISNSITTAAYYFNIPGGNPIWDSVTFKPVVYSGIPTSYSYSFGDGGTASQTSELPVTHVYKKLLNYTTSLLVTSGSGTATAINQLNLVKESSPIQLMVDSIHFVDSGHLVTLTAHVSGGTPPYTYGFLFGDGKSADTILRTPTWTITHSYSSTNTFTVSIGVIDSIKNTASYTYTLTDTLSNACRIDYYIQAPKPIKNPNAFSNVTVNYTDGSGNVYTSNNASQPNNNTFQVTSVSDYENNTNNQPTKMLKVTFNCTLYPVLGGLPIQATNCTATIAVAYH
jgi:hypothetical protein